MLKGYLGRKALSLRRGILSLNQDRHLCQGQPAAVKVSAFLVPELPRTFGPSNRIARKLVRHSTHSTTVGLHQPLSFTDTHKRSIYGSISTLSSSKQ